jgi:hypothetical protein
MAFTYTQAHLDALMEALLTGAEEVSIGDRKMKFRSPEHLQKMIKIVSDALEGVSADATSTKTIQATYSKGRSE